MNTDITKQMEMVLYRTEDDNVTVSALIIVPLQLPLYKRFKPAEKTIHQLIALISTGINETTNIEMVILIVW